MATKANNDKVKVGERILIFGANSSVLVGTFEGSCTVCGLGALSVSTEHGIKRYLERNVQHILFDSENKQQIDDILKQIKEHKNEPSIIATPQLTARAAPTRA